MLRPWEDRRRKRNGNVKSDAATTLLYDCASKAFSAFALNLHVFLLFFRGDKKEGGERLFFAYPVAQEGAQDVDNQKEGEVTDTLGQIGGRGKIGGSYIYCQELKFIIPNVMRQIILKYAGISHRSVKGKGKESNRPRNPDH